MPEQEPKRAAEPEEEVASQEEAESSVDPMAALEQERDQYKALAQRTQADFVNYKRRTEEERAALARNASNHVISRLLSVVDDLQRAIDAIPSDAPASWSEGVRMVQQNLNALVEAEGVKRYEPKPGDTFDPAEQEALYYQPTNEQPPGAVLSVVRTGYRNADRVLRPAQVVVAREMEEATNDNEENEDND